MFSKDLLTYVIVILYTSSSSIPFVANVAASIQRIDNSPEWLAYSPYLSIFFSSTYFIPYSQDCINLVIAINRFTAIASPAHYRKKSNGSEVKLCMFGIMLWFCSLPAVGFQLYFAMGGLHPDVVTYGFSPIIMTKSLTAPVLLILTNANLRADFRSELCHWETIIDRGDKAL
ncbi:hypothetical protein PRIPAC_72474 [Pristionchus pacificus]|uniref:G protein-coupled receptor n=1 Tax=Pristionchus pacificus TaxID=54126 RepID=A0A2A6CFT3_PRIPA|nr:hypothetical protein PRIPAC_72474 [Pristionchus pacificus]|eukprot:PDM77074.1 G protein-coupled receptor [Pristionchus pacificus]